MTVLLAARGACAADVVLSVDAKGERVAATGHTDEPATRAYGKRTARAVRYAFALAALRDGANTVEVSPAAETC